MPLSEIASALLGEAEQWRGAAPLTDRISILALDIESVSGR
jgi:hypothetical protein